MSSHTGGKRWDQDSNLGGLVAEFTLSTTKLCNDSGAHPLKPGYSISFNPSNNPLRLVGIIYKPILPVLNNWSRISLSAGGRVTVVTRTRVDAAKFLTMISVSD